MIPITAETQGSMIETVNNGNVSRPIAFVSAVKKHVAPDQRIITANASFSLDDEIRCVEYFWKEIYIFMREKQPIHMINKMGYMVTTSYWVNPI